MRFALRFSLETELGSVVHDVLKVLTSRGKPSEYNSGMYPDMDEHGRLREEYILHPEATSIVYSDPDGSTRTQTMSESLSSAAYRTLNRIYHPVVLKSIFLFEQGGNKILKSR